MTIEADRFRSIAGAFPSGVAIVTSCDEDGRPRGLTSTAMCSLSLDPPLLLVCLDLRSATLGAVRSSGAFVVNILSAGRAELSARFATKAADKFHSIHWMPSPCAAGAPVLVDDAAAWAACTVHEVVPGGDHCIVIGRVRDGHAGPTHPLLYLRRRYAAWPVLEEELS